MSKFASTAAYTTAFGTTSPSLAVNDVTGFAVNDLVLITDWKRGNLFKLETINGGTVPATGAGTLGFGTLSAAAPVITGFDSTNGVGVLKANSIALYFVAGNATTPGQLYFDPDGMLSTNHGNAQPLIDGVSDFQLAFGIDHSAVAPANGTADDGLITESAVAGRSAGNDEWIGNLAGESLPATPWNLVAATAPILLQIRATLVVRTTNTYAEPTNNVPASEDGAIITAAIASGRYPRYRTMRTIVAPRVWNLGE